MKDSIYEAIGAGKIVRLFLPYLKLTQGLIHNILHGSQSPLRNDSLSSEPGISPEHC